MGGPEITLAPRSEVPAHETGRRLKVAREEAGLTQATAAEKIGVARTTLVAIEQGQRPAAIEEVVQLCSAYSASVNAILRREATFSNIIPRFRKLPGSTDSVVADAVRMLNGFVRSEIELENALGVACQFNYPPERPLYPGPVRPQAEDDALELRRWLGLGIEPILDMLSLLEGQLRIRVYGHELDSRISGLFAWEEGIGACMLFSTSHRQERVQFTAAHELGHFLTARSMPDVSFFGHEPGSRLEKYANHFASAFLMPRSGVVRQFAAVTRGCSHLTRRHVILLSRLFGVSRVALVRRLEELRLVRPKTWEWFEDNGGIKDSQAEAVAGPSLLGSTSRLRPIPPRITLLVQEAWERELYSEGQLSRMLKLGRRNLRKLIYEVHTPEDEANRLPDYSEAS
ncbi:MAG: XRE family transcriptional regulator [Bacteroidota bacterium]|nr:XRE family transcriptional regulator [Bacteroidota bacterium]